MPTKKMATPKWLTKTLVNLGRGIEWFAEHIGAFLYREMLKRNTLQPLQEIIAASDPVEEQRLVHKWASSRTNECMYIQVAAGLLFTTVTSCLQWPSVQNNHWSAPALLYSTILLSLVAIISASQQMLVLPSVRRDLPSSQPVPWRVLAEEHDRPGTGLEDVEKRYLAAVARRFREHTHHTDRPNVLHVFALQVPMMLLALAVVAFLASLSSIVFAPLAKQLAWDDNARIATMFGVIGVFCIVVFMPTSYMMHGLFSLRDDGERSRLGSILAKIRA